MDVTVKPFLLACALIGVSSPALAQSSAMRVTVPSHLTWCATSQTVDLPQPTSDARADEALMEEEDDRAKLLHQAVYWRIEAAALGVGIRSLGVPYAEDLREVTTTAPLTVTPRPPGQVAAEGPSDPAQLEGPEAVPTEPRTASYSATICTAVQPDAPPPPAGIQSRSIPARDVYAIHCEIEREESCTAALRARLRADGFSVPEDDEEVEWRVRQALTNDGSEAAVIGALSDHRLRPLLEGTTSVLPPLTYAVFWLTVEEARAMSSQR